MNGRIAVVVTVPQASRSPPLAWLQASAHDVAVLADVDAAIDAARSAPLDLIVVDAADRPEGAAAGVAAMLARLRAEPLLARTVLAVQVDLDAPTDPAVDAHADACLFHQAPPARRLAQIDALIRGKRAADAQHERDAQRVRDLEQATHRLAENEQRYRALFDRNPDAVYSVRLDGRFTSANAAFLQLTGYTAGELERLGCDRIVAPDQAERTLAHFRRAAAGEAVRHDTVGRRKDGGHFDADLKNLPIVVDGRIVGVYGIVKDVTERNALVRARQGDSLRLATIFAQAAAGVAVVTPDGRYVEANPAYCRMVGYTLDELRATDLTSLTHPDDRQRTGADIARSLAGRPGHFVAEKRYRHRSGHTVWVRVSSSVVRDERGRPLHLVGIFEDITARHAAEAALRGSQALLATAERVAQIGGLSLEVPSMTLRWSDEVARIHDEPAGFSPSFERAMSYVMDEHRPALRAALAHCVERGDAFDRELRITTAAGRPRWIRTIGVAARDRPDGPVVRIDGAIQQIDVRKDAEAAVIDLNQRLRTTLESIGDAFLTVDRDWRITYVNRRAEQLCGYGPGALAGRNVWKALPGLVGTRFQTEFEHTMQQRVAVSFEAPCPPPIGGWVEVDGHPSPEGMALYVRDVGERRAARERTRLLESSIDRAQDIVLITEAEPLDEPGPRIVYANAAFERHTGYRCDEVIGRSPRMLQGPLTDRAALDRIRAALERHEPVREELVNYTKAGDPFWLELEIVPVADDERRTTHYIAVQRDITERKWNEQRMRQKLLRLSLLQQITRAIGAHQRLADIFGVLCDTIERDMPAALCAVAIHDAVDDVLRVECRGRHRAALAAEAGLDTGAVLVVEADGLRRALDGEVVHEPDLSTPDVPLARRLHRAGLCSMVVAPLAFESRVFGVLITAREEAHAFASGDCEFLQQLAEHVALASHEAQLHAALQLAYEDLQRTQSAVVEHERLRALAQMAGGIAHDINNAISPVTLYADALLESESGLGSRARHQLETIRRAIGDVAESVARLRSWSHPVATVRRAPANLAELIEQVVALTRSRWRDRPQRAGAGIELVREFDPTLPPVGVADNEVREALTNLILNAVDAMPAGGTLTLRTRRRPAAGPLAGWACVEVADTGVGMDELSRQRCLEPYFTTKGAGGTGLGLTMVALAMRRHGGEIEIDSRPGHGTAVRLCFPLDGPDGDTPADVAAAEPEPQPLRLLLVDDDPVMLSSLADILGEEGHRVEAASGGRAGIDAFAAALARGEPFDAVVTDLGMPQVDGRQVAAAVKAACPGTPVLMLTGWGRRMQDAGEQPAHVDELLGKPPRLAVLREALARHTGPARRGGR